MIEEPGPLAALKDRIRSDSAAADIMVMRGSRGRCFCSDRSITEEYALLLFRRAERASVGEEDNP